MRRPVGLRWQAAISALALGAMLCSLWTPPLHAQLSGVIDVRARDPGAIEGSIEVGGHDRDATRATVTVRETRQSTTVDVEGTYRLLRVPPGTFTLVVQAEGFRVLHVAEVVVRPRETTVLRSVDLQRQGDVTELEPYIVRARPLEVAQLDEFTVDRIEPARLARPNVDLPRTINDPQPYYIFDAAAIAQSGAFTIEDFIRRRVPMDVNRYSNARVVTPIGVSFDGRNLGSASVINLTGFGASATLVLVNGRRLPGLAYSGANFLLQPDVNGVPLAAIDRVEVLPVAASGIYGASAIGGVVNIVLRPDYEGAEITASYETPHDTDAPAYSGSLTFGRSFGKGRTRVFGAVSRQHAEPLRYRDRFSLLEAYRTRALANDPALGVPASDPRHVPLGSTPNIRAVPFSGFRDGAIVQIPMAPLFGLDGATITHVPPGYAGGMDVSPFIANAGRFNREPPEIAQSYYSTFGRDYPLSYETKVDAVNLNAYHAVLPNLELFTELYYSENKSIGHTAPGALTHLQVPATAPSNLFRTEVRVAAPIDFGFDPSRHLLRTTRVVTGFKLRLPGDWVADGDYQFGRNYQVLTAGEVDQSRLAADVNSGAVNIFRDLIAHPIPTEVYRGRSRTSDEAWRQEVNFRAVGPVARLHAGDVRGIAGLSYQWNDNETGTKVTTYPTRTFPTITYRGLGQRVAAAYAEVSLPLVGEANARRGLRELEVQIATRFDLREVSGLATANVDAPDRVRARAFNHTIGLAYRPSDDLMVRGSAGTAFLPPDFNLLLPMAPPYATLKPLFTEVVNGWPTQPIVDPRRGGEVYSAGVSTGGNPDARAEQARNFHLGVVLTPRFAPGLRMAVDYVRTDKRDEIRALSPQAMLDREEDFASRITRLPGTSGDPFGIGRVTFIDGRRMNFHRSQSASYHVAFDYRWQAGRSSWRLFSSISSTQHYIVQNVASGEMVEQIGSSTARPKFVGHAGLVWMRSGWTVGWSVNGFGATRVSRSVEKAQGGTHVKREMFHDAFAGYKFPTANDAGSRWRRIATGLSLQVGVKNVLNTPPAFDASSQLHYLSPYGDIRMGSYYLSLRKEL